jgi:hypothetical protein
MKDGLAIPPHVFSRHSGKEGAALAHIVLASVSFALLLAIVALIKERRLRLALQDILRRLIYRWRNHATTPTHSRTDRHNSDANDGRM